jgi:flavin-dependent dehydrogenase
LYILISFIQFDDVLRLIYDQAARYGAEIIYGSKAVAYKSDATKDKPTVVLEGGKELEADCIINAAGLASLANISTEFESMSDWKPRGISLYTSVSTCKYHLTPPIPQICL